MLQRNSQTSTQYYHVILLDSAWVNDVTELTGGNVDINVDGKTTVTGAVIVAKDDGNLNLTTNKLEYNDIHDFNTDHNNGIGLNTGVGIGTNKGESTLHPEKTTDVTIVHKGHDTEQTTHATIGAGNITVGDDTNPNLAGLNRDTDKVQEITKDEITGSLDASVTVDNSQLVNNPLDTLRNPWNALNTTIGLGNALANIGYGAIVNDPVDIKYDKQSGVMSIEKGRLNLPGGGAMSLGNTTIYYNLLKPTDEVPTYDFKQKQLSVYKETGNWILPTANDMIILGSHEGVPGHIGQSSWMGPLYLPIYFISGGPSANNWMEKQADKAGNDAYKQKHGIPNEK